MQIAFEVILVTGVFGGFFGEYITALPVPQHSVIARDLGRTFDKMYKSYISISNDRADNNGNDVDVISRVQHVYLDTPTTPVGKNGKQQNAKTAYLLVKTMPQRNKRYVNNYLSLCHFKICNMGPKRTSRYFRTIRRQDKNEA